MDKLFNWCVLVARGSLEHGEVISCPTEKVADSILERSNMAPDMLLAVKYPTAYMR